VSELSKDPNKAAHGFYPLSSFSVYKNLSSDDDTLQFPPNLYVSKNYYNRAWVLLRRPRRLKNVICIIEWTPSMFLTADKSSRVQSKDTAPTSPKSPSDNLSLDKGGLKKSVSQNIKASQNETVQKIINAPDASTKDAVFRRCFDMFDTEEHGILSQEDLNRV
jgi:hypothetical protein